MINTIENNLIKTAIESLIQLDKEIETLKQDHKDIVDTLNEKIDEVEENLIEIQLADGTIRVDISGLGYMAQQSFKEWCMKHRIANSEPVFNL